MSSGASAVTGYFILGMLLTVAAYDLAALLYWGVDATISRLTRRAGQRWPLLMPLLAFAMGFLYCHFFG